MKRIAQKILTRLRAPSDVAAPRREFDAAATDRARVALLGSRRLHLGCGGNVLAGWANVDLEGVAPVIEWDLTRPLPVAAGGFDCIYSEHFIEHIRLDEARALVAECHRLLKPDGTLRLSTPSLQKLVDEYGASRLDEWQDMGWTPASPCQLLNEGLRLWGHQFVYDLPELRRLLTDAGFRVVEQASWRESRHPALAGLESRPYHQELIVEATK